MILDKFSLWSSEIANPAKSSIHFSSNTTSQTKMEILNILEFKECDHKSVHLGLSFCKQKSKSKVFLPLAEKINTKLCGWRAKNLSQAGRTVLIKAVAQTIPSYPMSTCLIPNSISQKIDASMRNFWWGQNKNGNSLMLKTWNSICLPKNIGGLGFRMMGYFNKALFSELAWHIVSTKTSLWKTLIITKYLRFENFLPGFGKTCLNPKIYSTKVFATPFALTPMFRFGRTHGSLLSLVLPLPDPILPTSLTWLKIFFMKGVFLGTVIS